MTEKTPARRQARKPDAITAVLAEVRAEMAMVGEGTPLWGGQRPEKSPAFYRVRAADWFSIDLARCKADRPGWDSRILASAFRAFAQPDHGEVRKELLALAAAAVSAVQALDEGTG
ncbi:hypothetical protein [Streptomyces sp. NPDC048340]|uniref:hypothetical protein n=1 Tax=Streptomyces sp. NPDC048340 TaxID=3365537 RepID=UPI003720879A